MNDWQNFQTDILDVLNQYKGYFDFFERVGSLSDSTRPDCFARISREDKKEVWIIDAKNKSQINEDDKKRMENYLETAQANLIDIGLEPNESKEYTFRPIFITPRKNKSLNEFEQIEQPRLHQFLQRELIYSDTDKIVRDIAKMLERKELTQSQARLLFKSIKPFENKLNNTIEDLEKLEKTYVGLKLKKNYLSKEKIPTDVSLIHEPRNKIFFLDIPYSKKEIKNSQNKIDYIKQTIGEEYDDAFYGVINTFNGEENKYILNKGEIEYQIRQELGIISKDFIVDLFTPPLEPEKLYKPGRIEAKWNKKQNKTIVSTTDDINYIVKLKVPKEIRRKIENHEVNTRTTIFENKNSHLEHKFQITEDSKVKLKDREYQISEYTDIIRSIMKNTVTKTIKQKI